MILVTGATGTVGREVVAQLLAAGKKVRAMTRNPAKARMDQRVELVRGDFAVPESYLRWVGTTAYEMTFENGTTKVKRRFETQAYLLPCCGRRDLCQMQCTGGSRFEPQEKCFRIMGTENYHVFIRETLRR